MLERTTKASTSTSTFIFSKERRRNFTRRERSGIAITLREACRNTYWTGGGHYRAAVVGQSGEQLRGRPWRAAGTYRVCDFSSARTQPAICRKQFALAAFAGISHRCGIGILFGRGRSARPVLLLNYGSISAHSAAVAGRRHARGCRGLPARSKSSGAQTADDCGVLGRAVVGLLRYACIRFQHAIVQVRLGSQKIAGPLPGVSRP